MYRQATLKLESGMKAVKKTRPTLAEERLGILKALLREASRLKSVPKEQADAILEHACNSREHLTPSLLKQVGEALSKVKGSSDRDPDLGVANLWK